MFLNVIWMATAMVVGFMLGRVSMYGQEEPEKKEAKSEKEENGADRPVSDAGIKSFRRRTGKYRAEKKTKSWSIGSPASGEVSIQREGGEHPAIVIHPDSDRLYAPVNGKITRLFPLGNALIFTTEFGAELYIQAGEGRDDLLGCNYRPRIVQNEIVVKGKLLLEFDRLGLVKSGVSADVTVRVESCPYGNDIRLTAGSFVKAGEELLQMQEPELPETISDGYIRGSMLRHSTD